MNIWELNEQQLAEYAEYLKRHGYGWQDKEDGK